MQQPVDVERIEDIRGAVKQTGWAIALDNVFAVEITLGCADPQAGGAVVIPVLAAGTMPARPGGLTAALGHENGRHRVRGIPAVLYLGGGGKSAVVRLPRTRSVAVCGWGCRNWRDLIGWVLLVVGCPECQGDFGISLEGGIGAILEDQLATLAGVGVTTKG